MKLKSAVMLGVLGGYSDRFHRYQPRRSVAECLEMASRVRGVEGIEVVYPNDFAEVEKSISLIRESGLPVAAVNLNVKGDEKWRRGSFTSPDPKIRAEAVRSMKRAMDLAAELGSEMITCCPLIDGHNYTFQGDYLKQWRWLEEGLAEAASHRDDIRVSLEYKLNESRNFNILADMGRTLFLCERLSRPHVGVTMDVGHALIAKETPAEVMSIAAQAQRLFYIHLNDNGREWDWDMLPGSVNFWDLVEMFFYLDRINWEGWLSYDVFTRDGDPVDSMNATLTIVETTVALLDKLGRDKIQSLIDEGIPSHTFEYLVRSML